ncbi:MAG: hypothetical protein JOZ85_06620 [Betaproteobacteria bacterium]|nr:hypothetical protein [Betaproteobacteria bacterium]
MSNSRRIRLIAMLRRRRAQLPIPLDADAIAALQRCEHCPHQALCDEFLATPGHGGNRSFCPVAPYVESLREGELKF